MIALTEFRYDREKQWEGDTVLVNPTQIRRVVMMRPYKSEKGETQNQPPIYYRVFMGNRDWVDVLEDLVASGDLDARLLASVPTFTLYGSAYEWSPGEPALKPLWPDDLSCPDAYRCLLQPDAPACAHD